MSMRKKVLTVGGLGWMGLLDEAGSSGSLEIHRDGVTTCDIVFLCVILSSPRFLKLW